MAKLVVLSESMTGRSHELTVDKTTIRRVDDNTFPIVDPSVSSHHCEILLQGENVLVRDLNSTNGTFIAGEKISGTLNPGQVLRLGQMQLRLESAAAAGTTSRKPVDSTIVMQRGVNLNELDTGARSNCLILPPYLPILPQLCFVAAMMAESRIQLLIRNSF